MVISRNHRFQLKKLAKKFTRTKKTVANSLSWIRLNWKKREVLSGILITAIVTVALSAYYLYTVSDYNYSRGVLAVNTDKSSYVPGEAVMLQMASLDKNGDTLCNSPLELKIDAPKQWRHETLTNDQIQRSPTCDPSNNVTNEPDYLARFIGTTPGKYGITLKNTESGKSVKTSFVISEEITPIRISRSSTTRINPFKSDRYPMIITVTSNEDFKGQLTETLPKDFEFAWIGPAIQTQTNQYQVLTWDVELKAGESKEFAYEYNAPDKSPGFIRIGKATLIADGKIKAKESRQWQIASDAPSGEGMLIYDADGNTLEAPHYRTWTPSDLSAEGDRQAYEDAIGPEISHTIIESGTTRNEFIRGAQSDAGVLDIQVITESSGGWIDGTSAPTNGLFTSGVSNTYAKFRLFDITYEDTSGDGLVVYENSGTADKELKYRTWDGSSWSSEQTLDFTSVAEGGTNDVGIWIELVKDPGSNNIMLVWQNYTGQGVYGARWDGSAWQHVSLINGAGVAPSTSKHSFDAAWEGTSGDGMVVYGTGTTTGSATYTTGGGFSAGSGTANVAGAVVWLRLDGDPNSDYIAMIVIDTVNTTTADANVDMWNGSNWTTITVPSEDTDINNNGFTQAADVAWEQSGSDRALFVWRDGTTSETSVRYMVFDISVGQFLALDDDGGGANWCNLTGTATNQQVTGLASAEGSSGACTSAAFMAGTVGGISLTADPASRKIMLLAQNESALDIRPEAVLWNGVDAGTWLAQTANMSAFETDAAPGDLPYASLMSKPYDFVFADYSANSTGILTYDEDGLNNQNSHYRTWSGTDFSAEADLQTTNAAPGNEEAEFTVLRPAPTRDEYLSGTLTSRGHLDIQLFNGTSWIDGTGAPTNGEFTTGMAGLAYIANRSFDIAYEQQSGDAMVVYEDTSTANKTLKYRTWDGSTWSAEQTLDYTAVAESGGTDVVAWVELKARSGGDEIMIGWKARTGLGMYAAVWDGSTWQDVSLINGAGVDANHQTFDLAWEGTSDQGMIVYGTGTTTDYSVYDISASGWTDGSGSLNVGGAVVWLRLDGDPHSDYIAMIVIDTLNTSSADVNVDMWDGDDWTTITTPSEDIDINSYGYTIGADVAWEQAEGSDRALFVWRDGTSGEIAVRYMVFDISVGQFLALDDDGAGNNWCNLTGTATNQQVTSLSAAENSAGPCTSLPFLYGNGGGIKLSPDPSSRKIALLVQNETTQPIRPHMQMWDGADSGTWLVQTGIMGSFEQNAADGELPTAGISTLPYAFAFNKFTAAAEITISGVIRQTGESLAYDCSADTAVTVHSSTNGAANQSADCTDSGGTYSITTAIDPEAADIPVVVFIDSAEGIKGTTVTLSSAGATDITGLEIIVDRVSLTQESATAITNAHLATADNGNAGIRYSVSGGHLTVESPMELHVRTTETFAPGGNVTTDKLHLAGTYSGSSETLTLLGSGTSTARPLYVDGGTFTAPATTIFQGSSATDIEATTFNALSFTPTITGAVTYSLLGAETINGNFTINPTAGSTQLLTVNAGGNITVGAGFTTTISGTTSGTSSLDLRPASTDYNLSTGLLDIATAGALDADSTTATTITLTGTSGTLFTRSGTFTAGGSTVIFNPDAAVTLTSGTFTTTNAFNNLSLTPAISSAGRTYTFGAGAVAINGDFTVEPSGTQLLTVNMAGDVTVANNKTTTISRSSTATSSLAPGASNPALSSGTIAIAAGGTLNGTGSSSVITLTSNGTPLTNSGTFTPGSTTIAYVPANTTGVTVASGTYYNVTFNKASNTFSLAASGITATNNLTITAGTLDVVSGSNFPITVGGNWTNTPGSGGFLPQQGTVTFDTTTTADITGTTNFYNFTAATAGKILRFGDATTFTINGALTLTGSAGPSYVTLDSVSGGSTQWTINHQGTESISYASVKNSACDGSSTDISAIDGTSFNAGNNGDCWIFPAVSETETIHWPMDEATGSTLNDRTSNGNTGTLGASTAAPSWQSPEQCVSGSCLFFDGSDDIVTGNTTDNIKSISLWVYPVSTTTTILQLTNSAYISASGGTLSATGITTPTFYVDGQPGKTITANRWNYVTVTTTSNIVADSIILGNNSTNYFTGLLDEAKFFPSTLTAAQVRGHFAAQGVSDSIAAGFGGNLQSTLSQGLVGHWPLNGTGSDASASNNDGAIGGGVATVNGKYGTAVDFDAASETVDISYDTSLGIRDDITIAAWIKRNSLTQKGSLVVKTDGSNFDFELGIDPATDNDKIFFYVDAPGFSYMDSDGTIADTNWHHVAVTRTGSTVTFYIDGVASGTSTLTGQFNNNSVPTKLGSDDVGSDYSGSMDEVRIYNRGLSSFEIQQLYAYAPGPIAHWKLDENSGTTAADTSGNDNPLTLGSAVWTPGKYGSAFDGSGAYSLCTGSGSCSDNDNFDFGTGSFTIGFWYKSDSATNPGSIEIILNKGSTALPSYIFRALTSGKITFGIDDDTTFDPDDVVGNTAAQVDTYDGNWHYITAVKDGTASLSLYSDGKLIEQKTSLVATGDISNNLPLYIGDREGSDGGNEFNGDIDDIKIYNYPRTQAQITQDMNGGLNLNQSLLAHWKLDEANGLTAYDSSGNGFHSTLSFSRWTLAGKFGAAFDGNGSQRVALADNDAFDFNGTDNFSVSAWFKSDSATDPATNEYVISEAGGASGYAIYFDTDGDLLFGIDSDGTWTPAESIGNLGAATDYYDGQWHHVVAVKTGTSRIDLYVDGVLKDSDVSLTATGDFTNATSLVFGSQQTVNDTDDFNGDIDEVKIYTTALTADQIKAEYNQGSAVSLGSASTASDGFTPNYSAERSYCPPGDTTACSPPVHEYKLDEGSGSTSYDTGAGTSINGTIAGGQNYRPGKYGSGVQSNGSGSYINHGAFVELYNETLPFTFSAWVYPISLASDTVIICSSGESYTCFFLSAGWLGNTNAIHYCGSSNCNTEANDGNSIDNAITTNKWQHISMSYNGTDTCRFYVDGVDVTGDSVCGESSLATQTYIGGSAGGSTNAVFDNVLIYDYVRTPAQVAWEYNQGGPIAHYKLDECLGTTANNSATNGNGEALGNHGTINIGATGTNDGAGSCSGDSSEAWFNGATGKRNSSLSFDGTDDYIAIADPGTGSILDFDSGEKITLSAWFKPDVLPTAGNFMTLLSKGLTDGTGDDLNYGLFWGRESGSSEMTFDLCYTNTSDSYHCYVADGNLPIVAGEWHHVAVTYTIGTGSTAKLYFNGNHVMGTWASGTGNEAPNVSNEALWIGADSFAGGAATDEVMDGLLDEVKIYNYSLTPQQIKMDMNAGAVRFE